MLKEKGSCTVSQTQLMSTTKEKQHPKTSCMSLTQNRILKYNCDAMIIASITFKHSEHITFRQSQTKVVALLGHLRWITNPTSPVINAVKCHGCLFLLFCFFFCKKREKSPDYQFYKWWEGRTCLVPNFFVWDCKWRET